MPPMLPMKALSSSYDGCDSSLGVSCSFVLARADPGNGSLTMPRSPSFITL